jgi:hypothetical protein
MWPQAFQVVTWQSNSMQLSQLQNGPQADAAIEVPVQIAQGQFGINQAWFGHGGRFSGLPAALSNEYADGYLFIMTLTTAQI